MKTRKEHLLELVPKIEYDLRLKDLNLVLESMENHTEERLADVRNKLGHVTALIDLIRLRDTKHKDYVEGKLDEQVTKAIESIKYIKQL